MENDAPVVGPDAPIANSKMIKLNIAAVSAFRSASPRRLNGGDVDLLHRHHRLESAFCLTATRRKRIG
jgi:hypothetical protein